MSRPAGPPLFPGVAFRHAVSLGADCEPAHQLRRVGRLTAPGLFDWLVTPLEAAAQILDDNGGRLGQDFICVHEGTSVRCGAYGVLYHHEFPRTAEGAVRFTAGAAERCRSKMAHKFEALLESCAPPGPVLFIRCGPETNLGWDPHGALKAPVQPHDLNAVTSALDRRLPGLEFRLLIVMISEGAEMAGEAGLDGRIRMERVPRRNQEGWKLSDGDWDDIFSRLTFATAPSADDGAPHEATFGGGKDQAHRMTEEAANPPPGGPPDVLAEKGRELWRSGRAFEAVEMFADAYMQGLRERRFLQDYLDLLTGEARFGEVLRTCEELDAEELANSLLEPLVRAHAKLALQRDRTVEIALAAEREAGEAWLDPPALLDRLERACRAREPFSFVRLGDGEARFLIATEPALQQGISRQDARALGQVVWFNWFGGALADQDPADMADLIEAYGRAVDNADVLGVADVNRIGSDTGHYGYLAAQEDWLRSGVGRRSAGQLATSAMNHHELDRLSPHLTRLLEGLPFLGVLSPHPDLARRLAGRHGVPQYASYVIPAEGRLETGDGDRRPDAHFPGRYLDLIDSLRVPFPGAVFLVAAGLLGKIYCDRIKRLGGVALDVGSLADAWMGFDTRQGQLAGVRPLREAGSRRTETVGCLSIAKTGSMALTSALREAGFPEAVHLHYLGPRTRAIKRASGEPMLELAERESRNLEDAHHSFRLVASVRDPVARILSQAFYLAQKSGLGARNPIVGSAEALCAWWDGRPLASRDYWTEWFDDSFKTTFGFDFRDHPFDHERKSIRFMSRNLRLIVVRQEDGVDAKLPELSWLLERPCTGLSVVNKTDLPNLKNYYGEFLARFVAPRDWLDNLYNSIVVRHFYSEAELAAARRRWGGA